MKIKLSVGYVTRWGQSVYVCGSIAKLGNWDESHALLMCYDNPSTWSIEIDIDETAGDSIEYRYFVREKGEITDREYGNKHILKLIDNADHFVNDLWNALPEQKYLYTSGFRNCFFKHAYSSLVYASGSVVLTVKCPYVRCDEELILSGSSYIMGEWNTDRALGLLPVEHGVWQLALQKSALNTFQEYKFAIRNKESGQVLHWESGGNRILEVSTSPGNELEIDTLAYRYGAMYWHGAGVAIPVFSLRSEDSFGIGEFSDLKKLVDWASMTGQRVIQLLPVNDTTITRTWLDSYPYNSISIYALHPIYLGLKQLPLRDIDKYEYYLSEACELNKPDSVDYDKVLNLKERYLADLFIESGKEILEDEGFNVFYSRNSHWLFPYACFCYLRDLKGTVDYKKWGEYSLYDEGKLEDMIAKDENAYKAVRFYYFIQYLLHIQLSEARDYAHFNGVILKGDIPIGISRQSVDAWADPHLFNLGFQTGAPPDDFSVTGQNWGFPTYNWDEMAKDGYAWWVKRFRKMSDYFDAYRIDHILGFFRIWEIPLSSVQGLLGHFSPALPLSVDEIRDFGFKFDETVMTIPRIMLSDLKDLFGEYATEAVEVYLHKTDAEWFCLNDFCNTQRKIESLLADRNDEKYNRIRQGLYHICNEVLFIRDKQNPEKYHPRISAQDSLIYRLLDDSNREAFNRLYEDFFYRRHNRFWMDQALEKLPELVLATDMLACGEDLGMIPECVPLVMNELQILSLEIECMPKQFGLEFADLKNLPFNSVCSSSTHDMPPIRTWWRGDREKIQRYFNQVLHLTGIAPSECTADICSRIINGNLSASSMLTILPLQDWLSLSDELKSKNAENERINVPSEPHHYWRYRMHITLERLLAAETFNNDIRKRIMDANRNM